MRETLLNADDIAHAITEIYLDSGNPVTVEQIATRELCSPSTVRRVLSTSGGAPPGIAFHPRDRSFKRDRDTYTPSRDRLRAMINALRAR